MFYQNDGEDVACSTESLSAGAVGGLLHSFNHQLSTILISTVPGRTEFNSFKTGKDSAWSIRDQDHGGFNPTAYHDDNKVQGRITTKISSNHFNSEFDELYREHHICAYSRLAPLPASPEKPVMILQYLSYSAGLTKLSADWLLYPSRMSVFST